CAGKDRREFVFRLVPPCKTRLNGGDRGLERLFLPLDHDGRWRRLHCRKLGRNRIASLLVDPLARLRRVVVQSADGLFQYGNEIGHALIHLFLVRPPLWGGRDQWFVSNICIPFVSALKANAGNKTTTSNYMILVE